MPLQRSGSQKTLPVSRSASSKTLPVQASHASLSLSHSADALPVTKAPTSRPSSARNLFARSFRSSKQLAVGQPSSSSSSVGIVERALYSGSKGQLGAVQELKEHLLAVDPMSDAAREAYTHCLEHRLIPRLLQPLVGTDRPPKDCPLLQTTLSCLGSLACIGGPMEHCDSVVAGLIVRALQVDSVVANRRAALACVANISQNARCVQLLRSAQAEQVLKKLSLSNDAAIRAPACLCMRHFKEVPDSTLQARAASPPPSAGLSPLPAATAGLSPAPPLPPPSHRPPHPHLLPPTRAQVCLNNLRAPNASSTEQHKALHGIARFLGSLSPPTQPTRTTSPRRPPRATSASERALRGCWCGCCTSTRCASGCRRARGAAAKARRAVRCCRSWSSRA